MKAHLFIGMAFATSVASASGASASDDAPLFGVTGAFGARGGWGSGDEAILGGGPFVGARWGAFRLGALGAASWWRAEPGVAVDAGGFVSWDVGSIWLDPQLSAAWFLRLEPITFRWVSSTSQWAYVPSLEIGARAGGISVGVAGMPELGLETPPDGGSRLGVDVELRLGVDLVELVRLCQHVAAGSEPLAP
jgi:hypothetical protein